MIPAAFDYLAPTSLDEALAALAEGGDELKILAGGQSLIPLLKLRLAAPATLMDLGRVPGLTDLQCTSSGLTIGAMVTHDRVMSDSALRSNWPILTDAGADLADPLIRARGTFGGSLVHGDPAGDWPAVALALDAVLHLRSSRGSRQVAAGDFFTFLFTTDIAEDEILTHVTLPVPTAGTVSAYVKIAHPASGYAVAAAGVRLDLDPDGTCGRARIGLTGVSTTPVRSAGAEAALEGRVLDAAALRDAAAHAADGIDVTGDTYAPSSYRSHLIGVVVRRAADKALARSASNRRDPS
jgi:carbon-monoxide dehydrogenase medium subunit